MKNIIIASLMFVMAPFVAAEEVPFYKKAVTLINLKEKEKLGYLRSIGEPGINAKGYSSVVKPWAHGQNLVGYIPNPAPGEAVGTILSGNTIPSNSYEEIKKINIRLDRVKIFDYPGVGKQKNIQLTFETQNILVGGGAEDVAFTQAFTVQEGEGAGIAGYPIFQGLNLGTSGLLLHVTSLNLKTSKQVKALGIMESKTFNAGLSLLNTAQPAVVPFTALAMGVAKMATENGDGVVVNKFDLGLDFDAGAATGVRLREGSYIVVQAADNQLKWSDCEIHYNENSRITLKNGNKSDIPFNYVIFRVTTK